MDEQNNNAKVKNEIYSSGAARSKKVRRFDFIPRVLLERLAERYELGALKYGEFNYRKGFEDKEYVRDVFNHIQNHLQAYMNPRCDEEFDDDNLAAIAWGIAFLMECETEEPGKSILDALRNKKKI